MIVTRSVNVAPCSGGGRPSGKPLWVMFHSGYRTPPTQSVASAHTRSGGAEIWSDCVTVGIVVYSLETNLSIDKSYRTAMAALDVPRTPTGKVLERCTTIYSRHGPTARPRSRSLPRRLGLA
jgi:hypothetical protein